MAIGLALIVSLGLAAACAVVEPPPGGPIDITPPHLASMDPDSGTTGLGELKTIRLTFSEKMDRTSAVTWLHFFPDQRIRQTKWHGATEAEVILEYPLTPDTVLVVEIAADMRDAHKVKGMKSRRFPIATAGAIPTGSIQGVLIMADSAVTNAVVELYDIPPDTLEYFQQPLLRRTATDEKGAYSFDWLPVPGGPWLARAYTDPDHNLRPGDKEAQRLLPDTLQLTVETPQVTAGVTTLYAWNEPGRLLVGPFDPPPYGENAMAWTLSISEEDTGWVPAPEDGTGNPIFPLDPAGGSIVGEVNPGTVRAIMFIDVDGDSTFSGIPDSLLTFIPDSLRTASTDTIASSPDDSTSVGTWFLEPWLMIEGIQVEPGMKTDLEIPVLPYSLTPWTPPEPEPAVVDSLGISSPETSEEGE